MILIKLILTSPGNCFKWYKLANNRFFLPLLNNFNVCFLYSNISITDLNSNHSGKYECMLNSSSGARSQSTLVTVISNKTKFCGVEGDAN